MNALDIPTFAVDEETGESIQVCSGCAAPLERDEPRPERTLCPACERRRESP
jgi:hypothetical protein